MAHPMSTLGIVHTLFSLVPIVAGVRAFLQDGRIIPRSPSGKLYLYGMLASVVTSFGLSSTGGINSGHILGVLALAAIACAWYAQRLHTLGGTREYLETAAMSFSFLLLMVPGLNESLSRLPPGNPIGNGPDSPPVQLALLCALLVFCIGVAYQFYRLRARRRTPTPAH